MKSEARPRCREAPCSSSLPSHFLSAGWVMVWHSRPRCSSLPVLLVGSSCKELIILPYHSFTVIALLTLRSSQRQRRKEREGEPYMLRKKDAVSLRQPLCFQKEPLTKLWYGLFFCHMHACMIFPLALLRKKQLFGPDFLLNTFASVFAFCM